MQDIVELEDGWNNSFHCDRQWQKRGELKDMTSQPAPIGLESKSFHAPFTSSSIGYEKLKLSIQAKS